MCRSHILADVQDLVKELLHCIAELSKIFFTKTHGIDPLFSRAIVPVLIQLFRLPDLQIITLAGLKCLGTIIYQSCVVPIRSQNLFRDLVDQNVIGLLCQMLQSASQGEVTAIHKVAVQVLSLMINPPIGSQFSFPWVRGPHDQLIEYNDAVNSFESVRMTVYKFFTEFAFCQSLMNVYHQENEAEHLVTKISVMRIVTQLARIKKDNLTDLGLTHL